MKHALTGLWRLSNIRVVLPAISALVLLGCSSSDSASNGQGSAGAAGSGGAGAGGGGNAGSGAGGSGVGGSGGPTGGSAGSNAGTAGAAAAAGSGAGGSGGAAECTADDLSRCPTRACETATGCESGSCEYSKFECSGDGTCPGKRCVATEILEGGEVTGYANSCDFAVNAPCSLPAPGQVGACDANDQCVPVVLNGGLVSSVLHESLGGVTLHGELGMLRQSTAPVCVGTLCVSGSISP